MNQHTDEERPGPDTNQTAPERKQADTLPPEVGGTGGPEPTRFGDWEKKGRCIDF